MSDDSLTVRAATPADRDRIAALLDANDLPHSDLRLDAGPFVVAEVDGEVLATGGVERHGQCGLLRSLAVSPASHGQGYGTALCDSLEASAREDDVEALYLLTTTASAFFRERGYEAVERERVPDEIRQTSQFTSVCPTSATCMHNSL